ncbi:hypothetical protein SISNIDRAFT_457362 [Sistotremastrum niveocremeum HHB9708]|uniref:Uncharacterized protein n=2 Tax=Sistotremastraceae TaxID=3402574 RepID=A0A164RPB5_9AGAM|nr:hypothetical protein SISNIDRAFT_457362 [Sistotremastrum niveocremeum HHB9708]KZT38077.1 hypothetical protein SISSUDRAFT_1047553 [Sistotremastrum suecicum HHB10207 ss-3]
MSIHKSQGQTIPRVKVDLGRVFEKGEVRQPGPRYSPNTPSRSSIRRTITSDISGGSSSSELPQ